MDTHKNFWKQDFWERDYWKQSKQIHSGIRKVALNYDIMIGFESAGYISEALNKLKRGFFKIPFFGKREWLRRIVFEDAEAFAVLAPHIRIELIHEGHVMFWNGWGFKINADGSLKMEDNYNEDDDIILPLGETLSSLGLEALADGELTKAREQFLSRAGGNPIYITIVLGTNIKPFIGLLEGLDT